MKYHDGRVYKGSFIEDKFEGQGVMTWPSGKVYDGNWQASLQHGEGLYTDQDKNIKKGLWNNGKLIKWFAKDDYNQGLSDQPAVQE